MMMRTFLTPLLLVATLTVVLPGAEVPTSKVDAVDGPVNAEATRFFETRVRPLLAERCFQCHDDKKQRGDLRLDSRAAMLLGGSVGPAVVPGDPAKSLFIKAIRYEDEDLQMPPKGKLGDDEIATLTQWIKLGAPWPGEKAIGGAAVRPAMSRITDEDRRYWFYQPLSRAEPPRVKALDRVSNPIDSFLLAKLEANGLSYAKQAGKLALIRRATFDLHGLPPSPQEVEAFVNDPSDDAYEKLIDRLLASPRYGERMARRWLDIVRYADSDGFRQDEYRPHIWRYRDWVINAFNSDMPYDRFVTDQIAGDQASPGDPASLIATGYLRLWPYEYNQRDVHKQWNEILDDVTGNAGEVFLGLSMYCARCHNHKFDPILQEDYFRLRAFFEPILPDDTLTIASPGDRAAHDRKLREWEEKTREIRGKIEAIEAPARASAMRAAVAKFGDEIKNHLLAPVDELAPADRQIRDLAYRQVDREVQNIGARIKGEKKTELDRLEAELKKFDHLKPAPLIAVTAIRDVSSAAPPTMIPGDRRQRLIEPGFLAVLSKELNEPAAGAIEERATDNTRFVSATAANGDAQTATASKLTSTGRRLELARWITRPDNALTTRVIVNRIWQQHFGAGIVSTANDFGRQGEKPTHPQLLDWLAQEFVAGGWSFKKLHRTIMLSHAYRQSSLGEGNGIDPGNKLLWKQRSRRLEAEQIRDAMLMAGGELDATMHGVGVAQNLARRTIYLKFMRNNRPEFVETFDGPDGFNSTSQRNVTTIAPQSLMLINGEWTLQRARKLAEAARSESAGRQPKMIEAAYRRALGRPPVAEEVSDITRFIASRSRQSPASGVAAGQPEAKPEKPMQGLSFEFGKGQVLKLADSPALKLDELTIETVFMIRSIDANASVRTIMSKWDGVNTNPGWALGVTGQKSKFSPQTLILQIVGKNEDGQPAYDVVVSGVKPKLNTPYHLTVSVRFGQVDSNGIAFHLRPLADGGQTEIAQVGHTAIRDIDNNLALVIGGRDARATAPHGWDGILANVRLYKEGLSPQQLLGGRSPKTDALIGDWRFAASEPEKDASGKGHHLTSPKLTGGATAINAGGSPAAGKSDPAFEAFVDVCHVLLNSNEFLYVD